MEAPRTDLIRMHSPGVSVRSEGDGKRTLYGHAAVFDQWTEIRGWEGHFRERIRPGAFTKTIKERGQRVKVLYDHGMDPTLGNKPLGPLRRLEEDAYGLLYEVELLDTDYNRNFIIPAIEAGTLGASFRFGVIKDAWDKESTDMPDRDLLEVRLEELGPVTFPAYEGATAGVRSQTEYSLWRSLDESGRADFMRLVRQAHDLATPQEPAPQATNEPPQHSVDPERLSTAQLQQRLTLITLKEQ